jgi:hypothetical protein
MADRTEHTFSPQTDHGRPYGSLICAACGQHATHPIHQPPVNLGAFWVRPRQETNR